MEDTVVSDVTTARPQVVSDPEEERSAPIRNLWLYAKQPQPAAVTEAIADGDLLPVPADPGALAGRLLPEDAGFTRLLVGAPGQPLPAVHDVANVIRSLDRDARDHVIVTAFGAELSGERTLAQRLADTLDLPIRARHGLILTGEDGKPGTFSVDPSGHLSWQPFAQVSLYAPGGSGATVEQWRDPIPGAFALGGASYRLTSGWTIDVVPAGLVARTCARPPDAGLRSAPTDPERVELLIDTRDGEPLPDDMLTSLGRMADALPGSVRVRLRLLVPVGLPESLARMLRCAVPAPLSTYAVPAAQSTYAVPAAQSTYAEPAVGVRESAAGSPPLVESYTGASRSVRIGPPATTLVVSSAGRMLLR